MTYLVVVSQKRVVLLLEDHVGAKTTHCKMKLPCFTQDFILGQIFPHKKKVKKGEKDINYRILNVRFTETRSKEISKVQAKLDLLHYRTSDWTGVC
jgi:hypothetical protein